MAKKWWHRMWTFQNLKWIDIIKCLISIQFSWIEQLRWRTTTRECYAWSKNASFIEFHQGPPVGGIGMYNLISFYFDKSLKSSASCIITKITVGLHYCLTKCCKDTAKLRAFTFTWGVISNGNHIWNLFI